MKNLQADLILLTQQFPFESGEEFIANEICFLSEYFNKIYLIPTLVRDFSKARDVPANVEVVRFENPSGPVQIGVNFLSHLPGFFASFNNEIKSTRLDFQNLKYLSYHIPLAIKVKNKIAEIIQKKRTYSFYSYWMDTNAFALVLLKQTYPKLEFYIRTHSGDLYDERQPTGSVMFRKSVYEAASLIAPISQHGTHYIGQKWPEFVDKTETFHLGVKQQPFNPIPTNQTFRIVSCSSINAVKRIEKIIQVLSHLSVKVEWIHFGGRPQEIETINKLALSFLNDNVKFSFKGHVSNTELMEFYRNEPCDLFINLSLFEGIPVSIMEAASFGLPILSNDVGGVKEIVGDDTGILVDSDESPVVIAGKITSFLNSGKSRNQEFRNTVWSFWKNNFDAEKNYNSFIERIKHYNCTPMVNDSLK